jgi:hypothetical protein
MAHNVWPTWASTSGLQPAHKFQKYYPDVKFSLATDLFELLLAWEGCIVTISSVVASIDAFSEKSELHFEQKLALSRPIVQCLH